MLVRERVRFETGLLFSRCAALADLVSRLADADSGMGGNASLIDLGGLGGLDAVTGVGVDLTFLTGRLLRMLLFLSRFITGV